MFHLPAQHDPDSFLFKGTGYRWNNDVSRHLAVTASTLTVWSAYGIPIETNHILNGPMCVRSATYKRRRQSYSRLQGLFVFNKHDFSKLQGQLNWCLLLIK